MNNTKQLQELKAFKNQLKAFRKQLENGFDEIEFEQEVEIHLTGHNIYIEKDGREYVSNN